MMRVYDLPCHKLMDLQASCCAVFKSQWLNLNHYRLLDSWMFSLQTFL